MESEEPLNYPYVDVSGDIVLGDFSGKASYVSTLYNGEEFEGRIYKEYTHDTEGNIIGDIDHDE